MPSKTLKLAFAMGGGVSLGAFSGSALTEAIKLALLKIAEGGADYDKVEIDVFSGASAGSLSLAVMLRALTWRTKAEVKKAEETLIADYGDLFTKAEPSIQKDLIAAQVAQDLQNIAWVQEINLVQLLGGNDPKREEKLRTEPGLLDSEAVYRIARMLLLPEFHDDVIWDDRRLLAGRSLFACTLTSLTPFTFDARKSVGVSDANLPGLRDALVSNVHKDMRVFDILFEETLTSKDSKAIEIASAASVSGDNPVPDHRERWFRLHSGPNVDGVAWNYQSQASWATLAATAIASGAFPAAFAPAVLQRYSWEYGWVKGRRGNAAKLNNLSCWPQAMKKTETEEHPFAYVDGGIFNNDPVREAFRMVSYVDQRSDPKTFLRQVIYVDPSVGPEESTHRVPALQEWGTQSSSIWNAFGPDASKARPTFQRLLGLLGSLAGALVSQGRSRDSDGMVSTQSAFATRTQFRQRTWPLLQSVDEANATAMWSLLSQACIDSLEDWPAQLIPPGDSSQAGELTRVIYELGYEPLLKDLEEYVKKGFASPELMAARSQWLHAHLALYFDLVMGLDGKREDARLIAITPYQGKAPYNKITPLKLLGEPLSAFTGFMSRAAREHDFEAGRYCAGLFLDEAASTSPPAMLPTANTARISQPPKKTETLHQRYRQELRTNMALLQQRLTQVVKDGTIPLAGGLLNMFGVDDMLSGQVDEIVAERFTDGAGDSPAEKKPIEIVILVPPGEKLELDAKAIGRGDGAGIQAMFLHFKNENLKKYDCLVTAASLEGKPGHAAQWVGGAVHNGDKLIVHADDSAIWTKAWAEVSLPTKAEWKRLHQEAQIYLRPVLRLDLRRHQPKPNNKVPSNKWEVGEAAVPLVNKLT